MALNPPLNLNGEPCRIEGEYFVMKRTGVEFEFKVDKGSKYEGKGYMVLTTARIVCLNTRPNTAFKAFDIPLSYVSGESFEQPIFGSNYIKGTVKPLFNLLPGNIHFKIWLTEGGCGTLIPAFYNLVNAIRKSNNKSHEKILNSISNGTFAKVAFVDPNDPSVIYLEQPQVVDNNNMRKDNNVNLPNFEDVNKNQNFGGTNQAGNNQSNFNQGNLQQNQQFQQNTSNVNYVNQPEGNYPDFSEISNQRQSDIQIQNQNNLFNQTNSNQQNQQFVQQNQQFVQPNQQYVQPNQQFVQQNQQFVQPNQQYVQPNQQFVQQNQQFVQPNQQNVQSNQQQQNQPQSNPKYFGFWGPDLQRNNNN